MDDNNPNNEDEPDDPMPEVNISTGSDESTAPVRNIVIPEPVGTTTTTRTGRTVGAPQRLIAEIGQAVLSKKAKQNYSMPFKHWTLMPTASWMKNWPWWVLDWGKASQIQKSSK